MDVWFDTLGVVLVVVFGICLGLFISNLRSPYWSFGYFVPFILVGVLLFVRFFPEMRFRYPFCWLVHGRVRFVVLCLVATVGLTTPFSRLRYSFERIGVLLVMSLLVIWFGIVPFVSPAFVREDLSGLETRLDAYGVCYQTTSYTCGPAAAVTALGEMGISAEEGELAILSHSSPVTGTLPSCLSGAINERYGSEGLRCRYRHFDSVNQLKEYETVLAVVKDTLLTDHCIAVLGVENGYVKIADPIYGRVSVLRGEFEKDWRFSGIVFERKSASRI